MRVATSVAAVLTYAAMSAAQSATTIMVGQAATAQGGALQYTPSNITASNGTVVTFVWAGSPGNHSVTQSSFNAPCQPLANGFDSGFVQIPANTTSGFPSWNITITNDQDPIWFYCGQLLPIPHCSQGMVGSINAPASGPHTYELFRQAAIATNGTQPGTPVPNLNGVDANATAIPGPFSGSITGFALPAGPTASGATGVDMPNMSSGSGSATNTGSSATNSPTGGTGGAISTSVNGFVVFIATLFGITLL